MHVIHCSDAEVNLCGSDGLVGSWPPHFTRPCLGLLTFLLQVAADAAASFLRCARSVVPPTSCVGDSVLVPVSQVLPAPQVPLLPAQVWLPASQVSGFAGAPASQVLPVE